MRALMILCFILFLPFLGALGHDVHYTYKDGAYDQPVKFTELGWLWSTYAPESLDSARTAIEPATWTDTIVPVLKTRSVIATAVPFLGVLGLIMVLKTLGLIRTGFRATRIKRLDRPFDPTARKPFQYKRK